MEFNALFLPLLGGVLFYFTFHGTQYVANRRPRSVLLFWCASFGLLLLLAARLMTMAAEWTLDHRSDIGLELLALAVPPILLAGIVGLALQALTGILTSTLFAKGLRIKHSAGIVIALLAAWYFATLLPSAQLFAAPLLGSQTKLYLAWAIAVAALCWSSYRWARTISVPLGAIVFRVALFLLGLSEAIGIALQYAARIKSFWTDLTLPLGDDPKPEAIGAACLACALGPVIAQGLNLLLPRQIAASRHFESQWINGFEDLIYTAARRGQLLMLTLTNRKVYIGHIEWVPPHPEAPDAFVQIVPYFSGYRTPQRHELKLITSYAQVYKGLKPVETERFRKVIPIAKIICASEFDINHFSKFGTNEQRSSRPPKKAKTK